LRVFTYDINADKSVDTGWMPTSPFESDNLEAYRVMVPSHDGVEVPVSIIHKKGLNRDGTNPAIVMGYGSYGLRMKPGFSPIFMAWYERGGVFAVAHIRGGGELGKDWRDDGRLEKKENTIQDFITAGEYLVKEGYTSPKHLAGIGRSAGGIPACGALVRRPDLFAAMIILVGATNLIRMETTENGPPNVMEYGSVTTPEGFKGLEIMDSYHRVKDGIGYPAVMLTTGLNDPRVVVWMATKMTARLQAASASDNPILMRVEKQGGHGIGSTKQQKDEEFGEIFAFLWDQFGMHN
jgi:prolyl oligopeptidase